MKYLMIALLSILSLSCTKSPEKTPQNFAEKIVAFAIENSDDQFIELPELYDSLTKTIPDDKDEKTILVQILKKKGFKITNWGRGNWPPLGARIIQITLKKDDCECTVNKMYYATMDDSLYEMRERIKCRASH
ncbi:hypothetical protein [Flavobacterium sp. BFFFF1]|uniref:hypothetical protein n=1 Tax=Flavobacterium sp. BFFFF1 TaxID=2015557 RepID=UPI0025BCBFF4|nr:hypothetical protein [Flavobacterium sp. BFFFF1]